jgi:MFS family permease
MHDRRGDDRTRGIWTRPFVTIFAINFVINMSQFMVNALVPKLADSFGATAAVVGTVTGLFAATSLMIRPFVGAATTRVRGTHLLAVTTTVLLLAFLCYAVAPSVEVIVIGRLLQGFGMGLLAPVTLAMASDALPEGKMASGIGIFSLGQAVGMAAGPAAGLWLQGVIGYGWTFVVGAVAMAAVAGMALLLHSEPPAPAADRPRGWRSFIAVEALVPAAVIFFFSGAYSVVHSFVILYGEAVGVRSIGLFFTAYALALLISRPLAGPFADRHGPAAVIVPGAVVFGVAFVLIGTARSLPAFLVAGAVSAFGYGICQPAVQALSLMSVDRGRRGIASNTSYMGVDLSFLVMPMIAGRLVSSFEAGGASATTAYSRMFLVMLVPIALGLVVFLVLGRRTRRSADGEPVATPLPTALEP